MTTTTASYHQKGPVQFTVGFKNMPNFTDNSEIA